MDEMLIRFSRIFNRWMTTPTPPFVSPTLLWDVLHRFSYTGFPTYRGRPYRQFRLTPPARP
jgi:hypothetical protein